MTVQTQRFIDLWDILGLRFQCTKCNASLLLSMSKEIDASKLRTCPNCDKPWLSVSGSTVESAVKEAVSAVKMLVRQFAAEGGFPVGCTLSLQVNSEPEKQ